MADENLTRARKVSGVYLIRNTITGKVYVGSSVNIASRWAWHRSSLRLMKHHSILLQRAWDKSGSDSFDFSVLEEVGDEAERLAREDHYIREYRSADPARGYNLAPVSGTCLGYRHTEEARARMSVGQLKIPYEERLKYCITFAGKTHSAETRAKMSASSPRTSPTPEQRAAISAVHKGKTISEAHKAAVGRACAKRNKTAEQRAKVSAALKGRTMSEERKQALSESRRGIQISQEHKDKISATLKGRTFTPEHLAKIKASLLATAARKRALRDSASAVTHHVTVDRESADFAVVAVISDDLGVTSG